SKEEQIAGASSGRGANHFAAAAQMNSEHLHPESARGLNRSRNGVGDIVELQIEPDLCAGGQHGAYNFGAFGRVKLEPDFEKRYLASELLNELECLFLCGDVERHDDFVSGFCHGQAAFVISSEVETSQYFDHEQEIELV